MSIVHHPSSPMESSLILTLLFLLCISTVSTASHNYCSPSTSHSDLSILHIHGHCSPFRSPATQYLDSIFNMASYADPKRISYLSTLATNRSTTVPIAAGHVINTGNYVVRVQIGSPGQPMFMVLDTSNDATWLPCTGCVGCPSSVFNFSASTTFQFVDCSLPQCSAVKGASCSTESGFGSGSCMFNQSYGGDSSFTATLSRDVLLLSNDVVRNYAFGCISSVSGTSTPPQGLLGLGRGSMSLISQAGSLYSGVFSYCLPSFRSYYFSGSLKLGPVGQPKNIRTTPLLKNPHRPSLYYVNLTGITVGRVRVPISPDLLAFDMNTGAGTIIDSGTVITRLVEPVYNAVRDEFKKQLPGPFTSLGAFDTCFNATNDAVAPAITLHFTDLDLKLPLENSLIHSSAGSLACLAIASAPNNVNSVLNIIANLQQQNLRILFDTANSRLGIVREVCN